LKLRARETAEKVEDVLELKKGPTKTKLLQKKPIAPWCNIGFPIFLA
jgi:hypothetical protein